MKLERKHFTILAVVVTVGLIVALVLRPEVISVETGVVDRGPLRVTIDEDGETRVEDRYLVSAPVMGRLVRLRCEVGDTVKAGEVIAHLYPLPLDTRARAEGVERLEAAEASRRAAEARVEQARALWTESRRALERLETVSADVPGSVAGQRLDEARTAERTAALTLQEAESVRDASEHEVQSARAALVGTEGAAAEPTLVRAPADGRVLRVYEECERIVMAGAPIVEIGDPERLEIVVDVLTEDAARLQVGAKARVATGVAGDTLHAHVVRIEPSAFTKVSPLGVEEQRVNVVLAFDGSTVLGDRYRVDASLVTWESDDVLRVPMSALFRSDGRWSVFVVADDGTARLTEVDLGHQGRTHAEVLAGLDVGDVVVLYPSETLEDGARVEPTTQ
ncbi:MAG: efflux RND transporter periplasmic adaptor subunit [Gemmatimonadales bacterium]